MMKNILILLLIPLLLWAQDDKYYYYQPQKSTGVSLPTTDLIANYLATNKILRTDSATDVLGIRNSAVDANEDAMFNTTNLATNCGFTGTTDWVDTDQDGLADGIAKAGTVVNKSIVTGGGWTGNAQRITKSDNSYAGIIFPPTLAAGTIYRIKLKMKTDSYVQASLRTAGGTYICGLVAGTPDAITTQTFFITGGGEQFLIRTYGGTYIEFDEVQVSVATSTSMVTRTAGGYLNFVTPYIQAVGATNILRTVSDTGLLTGAYTVFVVGALPDVNTTTPALFAQLPSWGAGAIGISSGNGSALFSFVRVGTTQTMMAPSYPTNGVKFLISTLSTNAGHWETVYNGGTPVALDVEATAPMSAPSTLFGYGYDNSGSLNARIYQVLVYSSALSTAQRQAVELYLNSLWSIY